MKPPYISKSDFKAAYDCATKLHYRKARFPTTLDENDYMRFLAEGGFMVELLAKARFPGGHDLVAETDQQAAHQRTLELLEGDPATVIYEAAALHGPFLARIDILRREGDTLHLIEVKSSSVKGEGSPEDPDEEFVVKRGANVGDPKPKWMPYFVDLTFQRMVAELAFPGFKRVKAYLCLVNKEAPARTCETLTRFQLTPRPGDDRERPRARPEVSYLGDIRELVSSQLLVLREVTELTDRLLPRVRTRARELAALLQPDRSATWVRPSLPDVFRLCRKCEYRLAGEQAAAAGERHGFQRCWGERAATPHHLLDLSRVSKLGSAAAAGPVEALLARGGSSFLELEEGDLGNEGAYRDRRLLQWLHSRDGGREHLPEGLRRELRAHHLEPGFPLHFLDFEACSVVLPHHAGLRPYERVAFQFSCHTLRGGEDERVPLPADRHRAWLNTGQEFPNFQFVRALRDVLGETGTVYVWSSFEASTLAGVLRQLHAGLEADPEGTAKLAGVADGREVDALIRWLERLLGPEQEIKPGKYRRESTRIRDLYVLCERHYFHPEMAGSTSIKAVLPAIWRNQPHIHDHPWFAEYRRAGETGPPADPYATLPPLPLGGDGEEEGLVNEGTGAIRVYQELVFRRDLPEAFRANRQRLLEQYCKLDTAAMLMIWKHWSRSR